MVNSFDIFFKQVPLLSNVFYSVAESHGLNMKYVPSHLQNEGLFVRYKYNVDVRIDNWLQFAKNVDKWPGTLDEWFILFNNRIPSGNSLKVTLKILLSEDGPIYAMAAKFGKIPINEYVPAIMYQIYVSRCPPIREFSNIYKLSCRLCYEESVLVTRCHHVLCRNCVPTDNQCPVCKVHLNFKEYQLITTEQHNFMAKVLLSLKNYY